MEDVPESGGLPFTPRAKKVLELALREALQLGHNYLGTEHILLGELAEEDGIGARTLTALGVTKDRVQEWVVPVLEKLAGQKRQPG
jgi:ATP-dependent Clp protease ATP-binding subunit ClpC